VEKSTTIFSKVAVAAPVQDSITTTILASGVTRLHCPQPWRSQKVATARHDCQSCIQSMYFLSEKAIPMRDSQPRRVPIHPLPLFPWRRVSAPLLPTGEIISDVQMILSSTRSLTNHILRILQFAYNLT
jgi:hypothetical protein